MKNKKSNAKIIAFIIIGIILFVVITFISLIVYRRYTIKYVANDIVQKIKSDNDNKIIYLYDDLKYFNDKINNYDKGSYITYYDNKINGCISNEKYKIKINNGKFNVSRKWLFNKSCEYKIPNEADKQYIKKYMKSKHNLDIKKVTEKYEEVIAVPKIPDFEYYIAHTAYGTIDVQIDIVNNKISISDNYDEYVEELNKLSNNEKIVLKVKEFDSTYKSSNKYYYEHISEDIVFVYTDGALEDTIKYMKELGNYLKKEFKEGELIVSKHKTLQNNKDTKYDLSPKVEAEYSVYMNIHNGEIKIKYAVNQGEVHEVND